MTRKRFPHSLYGSGSEPDPRFSLANERTFLAWIRTALALAAAGIALEALRLPIREELRFACAVLFLVLAILAGVRAWLGWFATEKALRANRALPGLTLGAVIAGGVVVAVALIGLGLFL